MFEGDLSAFRFKSLKKYFHYLITTSRREEKRAVKIYLYTMDPITRWADFFVFFFFCYWQTTWKPRVRSNIKVYQRNVIWKNNDLCVCDVLGINQDRCTSWRTPFLLSAGFNEYAIQKKTLNTNQIFHSLILNINYWAD